MSTDIVVVELISARADARKRQDREGVSAIELAIAWLGIKLVDGPDGTKWTRMPQSPGANCRGNTIAGPAAIEMQETSYLRNCVLIARNDDGPMFRNTPQGSILVVLDGYAIMPAEEYDRLKQAGAGGG